MVIRQRCCDDVKVRKIESHSHLRPLIPQIFLWCCDDVKDRKIESHSQRHALPDLLVPDVVTMSKIEKLKAIHNRDYEQELVSADVVTLSKDQPFREENKPKGGDTMTLRQILYPSGKQFACADSCCLGCCLHPCLVFGRQREGNRHFLDRLVYTLAPRTLTGSAPTLWNSCWFHIISF